MRKVNLLFVITKLELGGAQKQLLALINRLDKEKFNPFLFTAENGLLASEALSISELKVKRSKFLERPMRPLKDLLALIEIYRFIKKNNIEIVHTHSSKAGILGRWAAKFAKAKVIVHTVHGWSFNDYQLWVERLFFIWLERLTAHFTHKIIVVSNYDKQKGLNNNVGKEAKYILIRYGIDYREFGIKDDKIRKELGINSSDLVVAMISCLKPQKSPQDFIKLAYSFNQVIPNVKFLLVGDGFLRKKIERLILKFNLQKQVILAGWRRDIQRILSAIDIFVLTSLWEGLPIAVLEAIAASRPVLVTHTGAVAEVITEGKTGFLVPIRNMKRMSESLVNLLKDEDLRRLIGQNAKDSLGSNFHIQNMSEDTEDLYMNLIREE